MDNKNIFADNLRRYMEEAGKTRRDICNALGISYFTVSSWVNGTKYPRMDKVEMLAQYFGIQKSDLIEEKLPEETEAPAWDGGLPGDTQELIEYVRANVPADKAAMALRVLRSILEDDQ